MIQSDSLSHAIHLTSEANDYAKIYKLGRRQLARPELSPAALAAAKLNEDRKRARDKRKAAAAIRAAETQLIAWRSGDPHTRYPHQLATVLPLELRIRLATDAETITHANDLGSAPIMLDTSKGITVPYNTIEHWHNLARTVVQGDMTPETAIQLAAQVAGWRIDRITANGDIVAGCHRIPYTVQRAAAKSARRQTVAHLAAKSAV